MPRPPLPKLTAHPFVLRVRSLRILLEIVRKKYKQHWNELIAEARAAAAEARAAAAKLEALMSAIEEWLRRRGLLDADGLAVFAAMEALAQDVEELRSGAAAKARMFAKLGGFVPRTEQPEPVPLKVKYLLEEGIPGAFGLQLEEMRARILADFAEQLDAAMAQYRQNCKAAGLAQQPVSPAERERLEWLARHLVEGRSIPVLAREKYHDYEALRKSLAASAAACGLRLRRGGAKPVK